MKEKTHFIHFYSFQTKKNHIKIIIYPDSSHFIVILCGIMCIRLWSKNFAHIPKCKGSREVNFMK